MRAARFRPLALDVGDTCDLRQRARRTITLWRATTRARERHHPGQEDTIVGELTKITRGPSPKSYVPQDGRSSPSGVERRTQGEVFTILEGDLLEKRHGGTQRQARCHLEAIRPDDDHDDGLPADDQVARRMVRPQLVQPERVMGAQLGGLAPRGPRALTPDGLARGRDSLRSPTVPTSARRA